MIGVIAVAKSLGIELALMFYVGVISTMNMINLRFLIRDEKGFNYITPMDILKGDLHATKT